MTDLIEQQFCGKFCFLLGKTAAETVTLLKEAFKDVPMDDAGSCRGSVRITGSPWQYFIWKF